MVARIAAGVLLATLLSPTATTTPASADASTPFDPPMDCCSGANYAAVGDVDADGDDDLVLSGGFSASISRQRADGALEDGEPIHVDYIGTDVHIVDVSGDGRNDLVLFGIAGVAVRIGQPDDSFGPLMKLAIANARGIGAVGDYTGDGRPDLLSLAAPTLNSTAVALLAQQPDGSFSAPSTLTSYLFRARDLDLVDVDVDGRLDLVTASGSAAIVRRQLPGGTLAHEAVASSRGAWFVEHGDVDGDGLGDLVLLGETGVVVRPRLGTSWGPEQVLATSAGATPIDLHIGDLDADGLDDLVTLGGDLSNVHLRGPTGLGPPVPVGPFDSTTPYPVSALGDLNGDGAADLQYGQLTYYSAFTNRRPLVGSPGTVVAYEDTPAAFTIPASDPDGDQLSLTVLTPPEHGTITTTGLTATFQRDPGYLGADDVVLGVSDGRRKVVPIEVQLTVVDYATVQGTITDGYRGVPGIEVLVHVGPDVIAQTTTGVDGTYSVPNLPLGPVQVWFRDPGTTFVSEWWFDPNATSVSSIYLTAGITATADAQLVRTANVDGITVVATGDGGDGSLRQAVGWANANPGEDTIGLAPGATYQLGCPEGGALLSTAGALTITGDSSTIVQTCPGHRVLTHLPWQDLSLQGVTLTGGDVVGDGGGVQADDEVVLTGATVSGNRATGSGGGIYARVVRVDSSSVVHGNTATTGGGIWAEYLTLSGTLSDNTAIGDGGGAATHSINAAPTLATGNTAGGDGGGVLTTGGALAGRWHGNHADGRGGAARSTSDLTIRSATFDSNTSGGAGGAIDAASVTIERATIHGNAAGGAGGAVRANGSLSVRDATVTDNVAPLGAALSLAGPGPMTVGRSVLAGPGGTSMCDLGGATATSSGGSWTSDGSCGLAGPFDVVGTDPLLGPLADDGGPTPTRRPLDGSPLINRGVGLSCPGPDQRGEPRPMGVGCDAGSVEVPDGGITAHHRLDFLGDEDARAVVGLPDGGSIVVGVLDLGYRPPSSPYGGGKDGVVTRLSADGEVAWFRVLAGGGDDALSAVAVGPTGDVVVAGTVGPGSTWNLGGVAGSAPVQGSSDAVVARLTLDGDVVWVRSAGGPGADAATAVGIDAAGNIAVGGTFSGTASFGAHTLTSVGPSDGFIARYAPAGGVWWARRAGSGQAEAITGIAVTPTGTITATGWYAGTLTLGPTSFPFFPSAGGLDGFAWQLGGGGTHLRAMRFGSAGNDAGLAITTDPTGSQLLLTGAFSGTIGFGSGPAHRSATSAGGTDGFATLLSPTFTPTWVRSVGGPGEDAVFGGALGADHRSVLAVAFHGTAGVAGDPRTLTASNGSTATMVAALRPDGTPRWLQRIDGTGEDIPTGAGLTPAGGPLVTLRHDQPTTIGSGSQTIAVAVYVGATGLVAAFAW